MGQGRGAAPKPRLRMADKPQLTKWFVKKAVLSSLALQRLPGDSDEGSESDKEEAGRRDIQEFEEYMSEFVDVAGHNVSGRAFEDDAPEDAPNDDLEDSFNGSRKRPKRPGR